MGVTRQGSTSTGRLHRISRDRCQDAHPVAPPLPSLTCSSTNATNLGECYNPLGEDTMTQNTVQGKALTIPPLHSVNPGGAIRIFPPHGAFAQTSPILVSMEGTASHQGLLCATRQAQTSVDEATKTAKVRQSPGSSAMRERLPYRVERRLRDKSDEYERRRQ